MQEQGRELTSVERFEIARFLAKPKAGSGGRPTIASAEQVNCARPDGSTPDTHALWSGWGIDERNSRFQSASRAGLDATQIPDLKLTWAFGFPGASKARSGVAVTRDSVFVGSSNGTVYALHRASGCVRWRHRAASEVRTGIVVGVVGEGAARVYFGDVGGHAYAVDARTGELVWKVRVDSHPYATVTGTPRLGGGRLIVSVSSYEVAVAMNPLYGCCTFRGSVVALDAETGEQLWKTLTVAAATPRKRNSVFVRLHGPSGAPVWTSPAIDERRGAVYVGTGENYSTPASGGSDAIFALDLATGAILWRRQTTANDAFTMACGLPGRANCPEEDGPDFDYGASPVLVSLSETQDILIAAQKSGVVYGLDPADGTIRWQTRVGRGGTLGGVHWGLASEAGRVYVPVSDRPEGRHYPDPAQPGLVALDAATGAILWNQDAPDACKGIPRCFRAYSAAASAIPGVVITGALDGHLRAYAGETGKLLWDFETRRPFATVNGVDAQGGAIDSPGPVVAGGWLFVNSGYGQFGQLPGNVLLAFSVDPATP
ncbi:MAG: PQQ-binding-like beta-propeller repeat protein [Myxococcota bacterium]